MQQRWIALSLVLILAACVPAREFGVVRVDVSGRPVFFIREIRGLNYDVLVIAATSDVGQLLDGGKNYVYQELGPIHPYYRVQDGVLHLYSTSLAVPPNEPFPVRIVQHELSPLDYAAMAADPGKLRVQRLEVPLTRDVTGGRPHNVQPGRG